MAVDHFAALVKFFECLLRRVRERMGPPDAVRVALRPRFSHEVAESVRLLFHDDERDVTFRQLLVAHGELDGECAAGSGRKAAKRPLEELLAEPVDVGKARRNGAPCLNPCLAFW